MIWPGTSCACSLISQTQTTFVTPSPWPHAHLLAHLVSETLLPVTQVVPVLLSQLVSTVGTIRVAVVVALLLGSVLAVAFAPLGLVFAPHELVKLVVVPLSFPLLIFPSVIFVSLPAAVLLPLLLVALRLTSSGRRAEIAGTSNAHLRYSCHRLFHYWCCFRSKCTCVTFLWGPWTSFVHQLFPICLGRARRCRFCPWFGQNPHHRPCHSS